MGADNRHDRFHRTVRKCPRRRKPWRRVPDQSAESTGLDAGVLALPIHDDQLHVEPLFDEPFVLAVPSTHALAARDAVDMRDLDEARLLLLEEGHCLRDQALDVCRLAGADERDFRATSLETLRQMVASGVGITLLPMLAVQPPVPPSPDIRLLPFKRQPPHRRIALVWRRSSAMGGFLVQVAEELRALPGTLLEAPRVATGDRRPDTGSLARADQVPSPGTLATRTEAPAHALRDVAPSRSPVPGPRSP